MRQQEQNGFAAATEKVSWKSFIFLAWLVGTIAFSIILFFKLSRLSKRNKKQAGSNIPEWFDELLIETSRRLRLKKIPTIIFPQDTKSPAVYGLFQTVLLLPVGFPDQLSQEQAEHVLIHELCHLKRGDLLVHWFCLIIQIVYWFNPLLIWTRRQMRHVCEICCDLSIADVLREKTINYHNTLLATARELLVETAEPGLGLFGVFEEPFRLVSRLKWLEKKTGEHRKRKIAATIVADLIMFACVMPMARLSHTAAQDSAGSAWPSLVNRQQFH
jgi:beta-lactamase regulating signal transducer with metallopeptidase domain